MSGPLPGALLQRIAERLCTAETTRRVLLPILADLQFEWRHAASASARLAVRLRGSCAFVRALAPAVLYSTVDHLRATRRLLAWAMLAAFVAAAIPMAEMALRKGMSHVVVFILPAFLCSTLPIGCLFGVLIAGRQEGPGSTWRPLLGIAGLLALMTFGVAGWVAPHANQAFRERLLAVSRPHVVRPLARGDREMTFVELGAQMTRFRQAGNAQAADRFAVEWHKKPALAAFCLVMALSGAALSRRVGRRWLRILLGLPLLNASYALLRLGEQAADAQRLPPAVGVWGPVLTMFALALLLSAWSRSADSLT
jgi:hypothetical protein